MSAMTIVIVAAIAALLFGTALVPGAPIFALPIVAILLAVFGVMRVRARHTEAAGLRRFREQASETGPIEFTERDRETLVD
jgi:type III secretory pathway component EscV